MFTLAMVQMLVEGGEPERNRTRAASRIGHAAASGAQVVLLPEAMDIGWTHPATRELAEPLATGRTSSMLRDLAMTHGLYVGAGLVENESSRVYNSAIIVDPQGKIILHHRKLNELDIGHACYDQGDHLGVAQTPLGTFGLMICADGFAQDCVITRSLGYMGAQVILSPCAWAVPADHDNTSTPYGQLWRDSYSPTAKQFQLWIAGVSNVGPLTAGPWQGRRCIGCSLLVGPDGQHVLQGPYGETAETILYANITPQPRSARGTQWAERS